MPSALLVITGAALGVAATVAFYHFFSAAHVFGSRILKAAKNNVYLAHRKVSAVESDLKAVFEAAKKEI